MILGKQIIVSPASLLRNNMLNWIKNLFTKSGLDKLVKQQVYLYVDRLLQEGQSKGKDEIDKWFTEERAKVKRWSEQ